MVNKAYSLPPSPSHNILLSLFQEPPGQELKEDEGGERLLSLPLLAACIPISPWIMAKH